MVSLNLCLIKPKRRQHLLTFGSGWSHERRTTYAHTVDPQRRESPQAPHTSPRIPIFWGCHNHGVRLAFVFFEMCFLKGITLPETNIAHENPHLSW